MFPQYSPLFSSGLMSTSPAGSRSSSPRRNHLAHDSLPLTVNTTSSQYDDDLGSTHHDNSNAYFLTFAPHRADHKAGRSFLSLDLAETGSMRSMSLRRKDTVTSKRSTTSGLSDFGLSSPSSGSPPMRRFSYIPTLPPPPSSPAPSLRRVSRDSLRFPSPKPVPSSTLPQPPASAPATVTVHSQSRRQRRSNYTMSSTLLPDSGFPSSPTPSSPDVRRPPPLITSPVLPPIQRTSPIISPNTATSLGTFFAFSPTSPTQEDYEPPTPTPPSTSPKQSLKSQPQQTSVAAPPFPTPPPVPCSAGVPKLRSSPSVRSTATVNTRLRNRSAALAALEGRGATPPNGTSVSPVPPRPQPRRRGTKDTNFMSLSEDEDEEEEEMVEPEGVVNPELDDDSMSLFRDVKDHLLWVLNEEEDMVIPTPLPSPAPSIYEGSMEKSHDSSVISMEGVFAALHISAVGGPLHDLGRGRRDDVIALAGSGGSSDSLSIGRSNSPGTPSSSTSKKEKRRSTIETFVSPFSNFMDLKDEESNRRSWRSFVEIGS